MKKLYRSVGNRVIAGICGGLGKHFDIDPNLLRLLMILLCFFTAIIPFLVTYLVAWAIIPEEGENAREQPEEDRSPTAGPSAT